MVPMQRLPEERAVLLGVSFNGLPVDSGMLFMQDDAGALYASGEFLARWNLKQTQLRALGPDGTEYFSLASDQGLSYEWNHERGELAIVAGRDAFKSNLIALGEGNITDAAPYTTGGYLNYDVALTHTPQLNTQAGFFDLAIFSGKSLLTNSFLAGDSGNARLMTTWQTDRTDTLETLRIGDTFNAGSAWGLGVLYGGIQYGTNFALKPDYIPFATPSVIGNALLPSTVDIYINNTLRSREQVEAGPFRLQNLPAITGSGDMQVIVKDLLGREQVITQPFYVNPVLLRPGLSMHSLELGWQRLHYGQLSNDYADPFAAATYRRGISDAFTAEGRIELQQHVQTAGIALASKLPDLASVVETSAAVSSADGLSTGAMAAARFNYQGSRWSFNAKLQYNSDSFRQLGSNLANLPKYTVSTQLSTPAIGGTLSINYLRHLYLGESVHRIININYSRRIAGGLIASFTLLKPIAGPGDAIGQFTLSYVFGNRNIGSVTLDSEPGSAGLYTQYQQPTPRERGTGYRLAASNGDDPRRQEAELSRNETYGSFQAALARVGGDTSTRLMAQGSIAAVGGDVYFTRSLEQGFAIVDTKGIAGVPVMLENQIVAHTDRRGRALVTNVQAYQPNHISIDPLALPMETTIGAMEHTVVPRRCGCVLIDFDVRQIRGATLVVTLPDGSPLPPWTPVTVAGTSDEYVTGSRGEVFVNLPYPANNRVTARLPDGATCQLQVEQPPTVVIAAFIGPLQCLPPTP